MSILSKDSVELDLADERRRSKRLSDELDIANMQRDEARQRLDKAMSREKLATEALQRAHKDFQYAARAFGQHDWLQRAFISLCDALKELGVEVSRRCD